VSKQQGDFLRRMAEYFSFIDSPEERQGESDAGGATPPGAEENAAYDAPENHAKGREESDDAPGERKARRRKKMQKKADKASGAGYDDEVTRILETAREEMGRRKGEAPPEPAPAAAAQYDQSRAAGVEQMQEQSQGEPPQKKLPQKKRRQKKRDADGPPAAEQTGGQADTAGKARSAVSALIFESAGIRSGKDLRSLMQKAPGFDGAVSLLLLLAPALFILLQPDVPVVTAAALAEYFGTTVEAALFSPVLTAFAVFLLLWSVVKAYRIGSKMQRRRIFLRLMGRMEKKGIVSRDELRAYAAQKFGIQKRLF